MSWLPSISRPRVRCRAGTKLSRRQSCRLTAIFRRPADRSAGTSSRSTRSGPTRRRSASTAFHPKTWNLRRTGRAADLLVAWVSSLNLGPGQKLVPLAHNWVFEHGFLTAWLGEEQRDAIFHYHARDAQNFAVTLNDAAAMRGLQRPFPSVSLTNLCKQFGIVNAKPHDALADARAEADLYRAMLKLCAFTVAP